MTVCPNCGDEIVLFVQDIPYTFPPHVVERCLTCGYTPPILPKRMKIRLAECYSTSS